MACFFLVQILVWEGVKQKKISGGLNFFLGGPKKNLLRGSKKLESFIESEVPHLRLFLMLSMMHLKRWVATENVLTILLGNEVWSKFLI